MPKVKKIASTEEKNSWAERPAGPLVIEVGLPGSGAVYELNPRFEIWLEDTFPRRRRASNVVVGIPYRTDQEFESGHRPHWESVALMLTGLSREQLREFGTLRVVQPSTGKTWEAAIAADHR
jgi:hypothetical protein